jgi:hypothetical protein
MRHEDAQLQLWLASDRTARQQREAALARLVRHHIETPTFRQRAGRAMIALGERLANDRLAGDQRRVRETPRFAIRAS